MTTMRKQLHLKGRITLSNGYVISLALHLVLLIIAALWYFKPHLQQTWHQFEWELPDPTPDSQLPRSQGSLQNNPSANAGIKAGTNANLPASANGTSSPLIPMPSELPQVSSPGMNNAISTPAPISRTEAGTALRNVGNGLPSGNNGFSASLETGDGDAYIISQPKPNIVPHEEGEVLLEFRLSSNGTVVINSVNVLSYTSGSYLESVRRVLPTWKFGFRKAYNPDKMYRIRCRFTVNE